MTPIQRIELKILEALPSLNMKPTLERAAEVGDYLAEAKGLLPRGQYLPWLKRIGMTQRTANDYVAVARHMLGGNKRPAASMTIKQLLRFYRQADRAERERQRTEARAEIVKGGGHVPDLHHADCRKFKWPDRIDAIVTDPPWADMDAYRWLAGMAAKKLKDGGIVLVQVGNAYLPEVLNTFLGVGLTYVWQLSLVHKQGQDVRPTNGPNGGRFVSFLRPVLMFSKGQPDLPSASVTDVYTIHHTVKTHHEWEQPLAPWLHLLGRLVRPGSLVCDSHAGSGTIGAACRQLGLKYLGTEIDRKHFEVARGRLAKTATA